MGKNLHPTILTFFHARMKAHDLVEEVVDLSDDDGYIFEWVRRKGLPNVRVWLCDAYAFGDVEYLARPESLRPGDFILIAKPEGGFAWGSVVQARDDGFGLGQIGKLMGALRVQDVATHWTREEREKYRQNRVG